MQALPGRVLTVADRSETSSGYAENLCRQASSSKWIWEPRDVSEMGERRKRTEHLPLQKQNSQFLAWLAAFRPIFTSSVQYFSVWIWKALHFHLPLRFYFWKLLEPPHFSKKDRLTVFQTITGLTSMKMMTVISHFLLQFPGYQLSMWCLRHFILQHQKLLARTGISYKSSRAWTLCSSAKQFHSLCTFTLMLKLPKESCWKQSGLRGPLFPVCHDICSLLFKH